MKNKISILVLLVVIIIPQVASAAWWDPFSWKIFSWMFSPKTEMVQTPISINDVATTTDPNAEIEKLRAELEGLKNQKTNDTSQKVTTPTTKTTVKENTTSSNISPIVPQAKPTTINRDALYSDIVQKYTDFQYVITKERSGLDKLSSLSSERTYFVYLTTLLNAIKSDLGYLITIKDLSPRPASIEEIYISKFNKLKSEYDVEAKRYIVEREQDRLSSIASQEQAEKEAAAQEILDQQKNIQNIKVKIAEMDQLGTQIDTLAGSSLIPILNNAKKLDGSLLFYTFKYICGVGGQECSFSYPYENKTYDNNYYISSLRAGLQAIVANHRAFLNVELAKNQ